MKTFDVAIVGAGPAGMFAALHLSQNSNLKVCLIDKNNFLGGNGARTDGKLNLSYGIGMDLEELKLTPDEALEMIDDIDKQFSQFIPLEDLNNDSEKIKFWQNVFHEKGMNLVFARQKHMGTDRAFKIMNAFKELLESRNVTILLNFEVKDIVKNEFFELLTEKETIKSKYLIVAPGRNFAYWFRKVAEKLNVKWNYGRIDVGLRVEVPHEVMKPLTDVIYDPKIKFITSSHNDRVRTFCTNPQGFVTIEAYDDFKLVNGHALYNYKSKNTNFAILQTIGLHDPFVDTTNYGRNIAINVNLLGGNKPILQRLGDLLAGRRSKTFRFYDYGNLEPTLSLNSVTLGDISMTYPQRVLENLVEFLKRLDLVVRGLFHPQILLYAPEIKFYDVVYETDKFLETTLENLFVAGDGVGKSRGIVGAALTGILAANGILRKL